MSLSLASLLVSRDPELVQPLRSAFERHSIGIEVCIGPNASTEILLSEHFDAVIVDCDDMDGGTEIMRALRGMSANKNTVAIAVVNQRTTTGQAFQMGANFVVQKPVSPVNASRCVSAAVAMMTRERRRYYRHQVEFPVTVSFGKEEVEALASNVSEGGMALHFSAPPPTSNLTKVHFRLPDLSSPFEFRADLAWADEEGIAGIRFVEVPRKAQETLEDWLTRHSSTKTKAMETGHVLSRV